MLDSPRRKNIVRERFGELLSQKKARLAQQFIHKEALGWNLTCFIAKSNVDLRQEVFVMQLIWYFHDIFALEDLPLRLYPYRIISTGGSTGRIAVVQNTTSLDGLKKSTGYVSLQGHFERPSSYRFWFLYVAVLYASHERV